MITEQIINFISSHIDLTQAEFHEHYRHQIDDALAKNQSFVVGDARGADDLAQQYLFGKTKAVAIYHMFESPRNNARFPTCGGFQSHAERDKLLTRDSHQYIAWVKLGIKKSGTQNNLDRRNQMSFLLRFCKIFIRNLT
jgi:hypothetical protein